MKKTSLFLLTIFVIVMGLIVFYMKPVPQDLSYHQFADDRRMMGVPNALNVLSNLPFLIVGLLGMNVVMSGVLEREHSKEEIFIFKILFAAFPLVAAGSSYYHWNPNNYTLLWDRLPMTIAFSAMTASFICEKINVKAGYYLSVPLITVGFYSVIHWYLSELAGEGDLRLYIGVQLGSFMFIPTILFTEPNKYSHVRFYGLIFVLYGLAKLVESYDKEIYLFSSSMISGHTIKHLLAALATYYSVYMARNRTRV